MQRILNFNFKHLRHDLLGGLTAGIVALPLALAFGVQSGLGATAGIYGAIFLGFFASALGGTSTQVSGPTGPMTVVSTTLVALAVKQFGGIDSGLPLIILVFMLSGFFQVLFGLLKLGQYIRYIPYPVVSGFMSGIGVIILALQLFPAFGLSSPNNITAVFTHVPELFEGANIQALILTSITLLIIYTFPFITRKLPGTLIALLVGTLIAMLAGFEVPLIGEIPAGFPKPHFESLANIKLSYLLIAVGPALTLAGLGSIDTLLTSVVNDNLTRTKHNSNKELIGQGIGNMIAGIFAGLPGAGATMRTLVNIKSGGKTGLSGMIHGIVLLLTLVGLGTLVRHIPIPVLAGILISVGIGIIDKKGLLDLLKIPRADAAVMIVVLLLTVFVDLLQAVGIGMIIASVLFMKRIGDLVDNKTSLQPLNHIDRENPWADENGIPEALMNKIYIVHLDGPVFFGGLTRFQALMNQIPEGVELVVIRMKRVPFLDQSGAYAFETALQTLVGRNIQVVMTMVQAQPLYMLQRMGIIPGLIPEEGVFDTFSDCADWMKTKLIPASEAG